MSKEYTYKIEQNPDEKQIWDLFQTADYSANFDITAQTYHQAALGSWRFAVAYDENTLIAMGRLNSDGVLYAVLHDLITHPDYRQQGIASELLKFLEAECKAANIQKIQLFSNNGLEEFYERRGYSKRAVDAPGMEKTFQ